MNFLASILTILGLWVSPITPLTRSIPQGLIQPTTTSSTTSTSTSVVVVTTTLPTPTTRPPTTVASAPANDIWWALALCEDSGRNRYFEPYSGYFHFLPSTYRSVGGTGMPHDDDYETQKGFAIKLQERDGWNPWPGCARKLGLPLR